VEVGRAFRLDETSVCATVSHMPRFGRARVGRCRRYASLRLQRAHGAKAARGANCGDPSESEHAGELDPDTGRDIDELAGTIPRRASSLRESGEPHRWSPTPIRPGAAYRLVWSALFGAGADRPGRRVAPQKQGRAWSLNRSRYSSKAVASMMPAGAPALP